MLFNAVCQTSDGGEENKYFKSKFTRKKTFMKYMYQLILPCSFISYESCHFYKKFSWPFFKIKHWDPLRENVLSLLQLLNHASYRNTVNDFNIKTQICTSLTLQIFVMSAVSFLEPLQFAIYTYRAWPWGRYRLQHNLPERQSSEQLHSPFWGSTNCSTVQYHIFVSKKCIAKKLLKPCFRSFGLSSFPWWNFYFGTSVLPLLFELWR